MKNTLEESKNYFKESIDFFYDFQWLFRYPVTEILIQNCLDAFPHCWMDVLKELTTEELNDFVNGRLIKDAWPESLHSFLKKCEILNKLPVAPQLSVPQLPKSFTVGLSIKKQHEIYYLAQIVHEKCTEDNISIIVDFGAGLGYIGQLLNYLYNYVVIGLESNENNVKIAKKRQIDYYPQSIGLVDFIHMKINDNCEDKIENLIKLIKIDENNYNFCLIGLHACADLTVNACKLFLNMQTARILIIVPCCYHKLEVDEENGKFVNFPFSNTLRSVLNNYPDEVQEILRKPFLRLACQEPAGRWEDMTKELHEKHAFYVLARAVVELFVYKNNISLKKCVRKATRKTQCTNFHQYLTDTLNRYNFDGKNVSNNEKLIENISKLWELNKNKTEDMEIYTGLQYLLQKPAESLVLYDRYCWLNENNCSVEMIAVLNNKISPRCYAIVGKRNSTNRNISK